MKDWIKAFRLRTLPLSLSGIVISYFYYLFTTFKTNHVVFGLALLTTVLLQILSNLANDYGDGVKGTDNENRIGPERGVQSGKISQNQMLKAMYVFCFLAFSSGITLLLVAFGMENWLPLLIYLVIGLLSIAAAIKYTVGKSAYGYRALGDVFVFLFFGLVGVLGFYLLLTTSIDLPIILLALIIGFFSVMVLNLNNMRDIVNDKNSGKTTIPVLLGSTKAKVYHLMLGFAILICVITFNLLIKEQLIWLNALALIPLILHLKKVSKTNTPKDFDPELKKVALTTFLFSILNSVILSLC